MVRRWSLATSCSGDEPYDIIHMLTPQKFSSWLLWLSYNFFVAQYPLTRESHWARDRGRMNPQEPTTIACPDPYRSHHHGSVVSSIILLRSPFARSTTLVLAFGVDGNTDCGHGRDDCMERDELSFGNRGVMDWDMEEGDEKAMAAVGGDANAVATPMAMTSMSMMSLIEHYRITSHRSSIQN